VIDGDGVSFEVEPEWFNGSSDTHLTTYRDGAGARFIQLFPTAASVV